METDEAEEDSGREHIVKATAILEVSPSFSQWIPGVSPIGNPLLLPFWCLCRPWLPNPGKWI